MNRRKLALLAVCASVCLGLQSLVARAQAASAPSPALGKAESRLRGLIGKVFIQADIRGKGETDDERSYRFEVFDEANGYARVIGPFGGHDDFFLLRGESRDYLISIEYACGTACAQRATFHRFDAGAAPVSMALKDILDLSQFTTIQKRLLSVCLDSHGDFNTEKSARDAAHRDLSACPYVFSFPKKGSSVILFKVLNENGSDLLLSVGKTKVSPQVLLRWNGAKLVGSPPNDDGSILLNSDKMGRFF